MDYKALLEQADAEAQEEWESSDSDVNEQSESEPESIAEPQIVKMTRIYNIDSALRTTFGESNPNPALDGNSSNFVYIFKEPVRYVSEISLNTVELPNSFYMISTAFGNNTFTVDGSSVVIQDGNYDPSGLIVELNSELTTAGFTDFSFNYVPGKNRIQILTNGTPRTIVFGINPIDDKTLGYLLGFRQSMYSFVATVNAESCINLNWLNYVFLRINDYDSIEQSGYDVHFKAFTKLQITGSKNEYMQYENDVLGTKIYKFPIPTTIHQIRVQIVDKYGRVIDLNGWDMSLSLSITSDLPGVPLEIP